jgi:hypothetical protein
MVDAHHLIKKYCPIHSAPAYNVVTSNKLHGTIQQIMNKPNSVAARYKAWVCCSSTAGVSGSNPTMGHGCLCCECCVLYSRGLCIGPILRPGFLPNVCGSVIVIRYNINPLHLQWLGGKCRTSWTDITSKSITVITLSQTQLTATLICVQ